VDIYKSGANIIGGCCGTTPLHISLLARELKGKEVVKRQKKSGIFFTSRSRLLECNGSRTIIIGERINPTGRKILAKELKEGKFEMLKREAIEQELAGADLIDLNVGVPEIDRKGTMRKATLELLKVISAPISFDSDDPIVIESGLRILPRQATHKLNHSKEKILRGNVTVDKEVRSIDHRPDHG